MAGARQGGVQQARLPDARPGGRRRRRATSALLREVLYAIAKCKPVDAAHQGGQAALPARQPVPASRSSRRDVMEFDIELPGAGAVRHAFAARGAEGRLGAVRLRRARQGARVPRAGRRFKAKAKDLGNQHLIKLLDAIALVAAKLPDPYPRQGQIMVIEMASAFLLVEHVIDHFTARPTTSRSRSSIMGGWLLDAAKGKSTGEPPPGLRADLTERSARCSCARRSPRKSSPTCSTSSRCSTRSRATRRSARRSPSCSPTCGRSTARCSVLRLRAARRRPLAICEAMIARMRASRSTPAPPTTWTGSPRA